MKRTIIVISLILSTSLAAFAQRDTVGAGYPYYFPAPINYDTLPHQTPLGYTFPYFIFEFLYNNMIGTAETLTQNIASQTNKLDYFAIKKVPDTDIHIIGIAYCFNYSQPILFPYSNGDTVTQVVTLYLQEGNTLVPLDSVVDVVISDSTVHLHRFDRDPTCMFNDTSLLKHYDHGDFLRDSTDFLNYDFHYYYQIGLWYVKESYFEHEISLSQGDTFYISSSWGSRHRSGITPFHVLGYQPIDIQHDTLPAYLPTVEYCIKDSIGNWIPGQAEAIDPFVWAIIRRDCDTCPQAQGLQYVKSSADKAFFRWQRGTNHHDWQLSYGPAGTAPEDGTIVNCANTSSSLVTLDPDSHYVAYVRARCKFARYEYGPWSAPLAFSLNGGNGIDGVDCSTIDITLTPNPATERVTVSATGMQSVELLAVDGTVILHREGLQQDEYLLDLKGLAPGLYMVRVSTPLGTATRRLLVQ